MVSPRPIAIVDHATAPSSATAAQIVILTGVRRGHDSSSSSATGDSDGSVTRADVSQLRRSCMGVLDWGDPRRPPVGSILTARTAHGSGDTPGTVARGRVRIVTPATGRDAGTAGLIGTSRLLYRYTTT